MVKNILITGGAGGIGLEIVNYFENKNFNIIILDKTSKNYEVICNFTLSELKW